jgi:hypothetical protein
MPYTIGFGFDDHPTKPGIRGGTPRNKKRAKAARQSRKRNRK